MSPITLNFSSPGLQPPVFIAASWTQPPWHPLRMDVRDEKSHSGDLQFYKTFDRIDEGRHQYKYRLGLGDWWVLDESAETDVDNAGNKNNILRVPARKGVQVQPISLQDPVSRPLERSESDPDPALSSSHEDDDEPAPLLPHEMIHAEGEVALLFRHETLNDDALEDDDDALEDDDDEGSVAVLDDHLSRSQEFEPVRMENGSPLLFAHEYSGATSFSPPHSPSRLSARSKSGTSLRSIHEDEVVDVPFPAIPPTSPKPASQSPLQVISEDELNEEEEERKPSDPVNSVTLLAPSTLPEKKRDDSRAPITPPKTPEAEDEQKLELDRATSPTPTVPVVVSGANHGHGENETRQKNNSASPEQSKPMERTESPSSIAVRQHHHQEGFLAAFWRVCFSTWLSPIGDWLAAVLGSRRNITVSLGTIFGIVVAAIAITYLPLS